MMAPRSRVYVLSSTLSMSAPFGNITNPYGTERLPLHMPLVWLDTNWHLYHMSVAMEKKSTLYVRYIMYMHLFRLGIYERMEENF